MVPPARGRADSGRARIRWRFRVVGLAVLGLAAIVGAATPAGADAADGGSVPSAAADSLIAEDDPLAAYLTRRIVDCRALTYNFVVHVPRLLAADRPDSAEILTGRWRLHCPADELPILSDVLVRMRTGSFWERDYDDRLFWLMLNERWWAKRPSTLELRAARYDRFSTRGVPVDELVRYADYVRDLAREVADEQPEGSFEALYARAIAGDEPEFFARLLESPYDRSQTARVYRERLYDWSQPNHAIWSAHVDAWLPVGALRRVGARAPIGLGFGGRFGAWTSRLVASAAIGGLDGQFTVDQDGELREARSFGLLRLGLEFGRALVDRRAAQVDVLAGVGYSGARYNRPEQANDARYVSAPDLGVGLGLRRPVGAQKNHTIGVEAWWRALFLDAGDRGDDIGGNAFVLRLVFQGARFDEGGRMLGDLGLDRYRAREILD